MNNAKGPLPPPNLTGGNAAKAKGMYHLGDKKDISVHQDMAAGALEPDAVCITMEGLSNEVVSFQVNKIFCLKTFHLHHANQSQLHQVHPNMDMH